jgi:trimeric autotransporter adhesin
MALTKASYSMVQGAPVNVVDYGASTSETAANNTAAFNAAKAASGSYTVAGQTVFKPVYVPPGTYAISGTVVGNFFTEGIVGITGGTVQYIVSNGVGSSQSNTIYGPGAMPGATPTGGDNGLQNSAFGTEALFSNTTGYRNTGVGYGALRSTITNYANTAVGSFAGYSLSDPAAAGNTVVGSRALFASQDGYFNTAVGSDSLQGTLGGFQNTGCGKNTLYTNTTGDNNSAFGMNALYAATTSENNTALGAYALFNATTGYANTSSGFQSLYLNQTGFDNAAYGALSLYNATGSNNSAFGRSAGFAVTTGSGNLILGTLTAAGSNAPVFNVTTEDNRVVVGSTSTTNAYVQVAWTVVSDERDKTDIEDVAYGVDFISKLHPVKFKRDNRSRYDDHVSDGSKKDAKFTYGFTAQNIIQAEKECGATDSTLLIADNESPDNLKIIETSIIPALVKAIQELKAEFDAYKASHP